MPQRDCRLVRDVLDDVGADAIPADAARHVGRCADCARLIARHRALVRRLEAWPAAPKVELRPPSLPDAPAGRLLSMRAPRWAAAAAAVVIAVAAWRFADRAAERVRVERVVDVGGAPPPEDERLLALTGGVEAVAMRRPTEIR